MRVFAYVYVCVCLIFVPLRYVTLPDGVLKAARQLVLWGMCAYLCVCAYVCMCVCIYMCVLVCVCVCVCVYIYKTSAATT